MRTEEEIRVGLRTLIKLYNNDDYEIEQIDGAIKALNWVLEEE